MRVLSVKIAVSWLADSDGAPPAVYRWVNDVGGVTLNHDLTALMIFFLKHLTLSPFHVLRKKPQLWSFSALNAAVSGTISGAQINKPGRAPGEADLIPAGLRHFTERSSVPNAPFESSFKVKAYSRGPWWEEGRRELLRFLFFNLWHYGNICSENKMKRRRPRCRFFLRSSFCCFSSPTSIFEAFF